MAASPSTSIAAGSELEPPSSPVRLNVSARDIASPGATDDDETQPDDGLREDDGEQDVPDKPTRSSKGKSSSQAKDANGQQQIGKIRHLKKEDGEPLWREDIQYDFLRAVFDNEQKVFTNSYEPEGFPKQTFADLYIDTMSRSTKTSKVLRDKLLSDREAAKGMAMVCLLVNMGRMNTTLNFFPEMRAQLRTYHAIPSLQAHQDAQSYKQLQDAPRLKSILKGGADDRQEPNTLDKIKQMDLTRTNPVNLIFVMCNTAQKVAELHFPRHREFHDLLMKTEYSSQSRAMAFLWLMWFYLESDFTEEGCDENPFGPGIDYGLDVANQGIPVLRKLSEEEKKRENVDTPEEIAFGHEKQKTRAKILEADQQYLNDRDTKRSKARASYVDDGPAILPRIRPSKNESDMDSTRSTPPPRALGRGTGTSSRRGPPLKYQIFEGSSPARGSEGVVTRKPRPPTAHQLAVERNRNQRVEYILDRGLRKQHHKSRRARRKDGVIYRAWQRVEADADPFEDSDDEATPGRGHPALVAAQAKPPFIEKGMGGLCLMNSEKDDFGEEVTAYAAAIRRSARRLARWTGHEEELGVVAPVKKVKREAQDGPTKDMNGTILEDDMEASVLHPNEDVNGDIAMEDVEADVAGEEDEADDPDRTEVMVDSDMD